MTEIGVLQMIGYLLVLMALVKPLGWYMAEVYTGKLSGKKFGYIERAIYRICGIVDSQKMDWKAYLYAMLIFNFLGFLVFYFVQRLQFYLPLNPQHFLGVSPTIAFNTAVSFMTNTDWQAYSGEKTLSYFTQTFGLTVQNFFSASTGMSLLMALIRGLVKHETTDLGNFWVDTVRGILYILLPLSLILAIILTGQGVIQNFKPYVHMTAYSHMQSKSLPKPEEQIPMGPAASLVAIKQLGSNGGGFFNANSAHPFENPTPLTGFLEMLAILLIPASLCYTFGLLVQDMRQGWAILFSMLLILILAMGMTVWAEGQGNPVFSRMGIDATPHHGYPGGNMEGKETRFGIVGSALWAVATTASANGSVNAMQDSFTPLGSVMPIILMQLGEVIFGGVGSGLYGMLMLVLITVFIVGLMVGRTPEYLGKKIEIFEMKMVVLTVLIMPLTVLFLTSIAVMSSAGRSAIGNPGVHGFIEILYAFTSMTNNNGSAFAGLNASVPLYTVGGGLSMLIGRYCLAIPVLAIAGSLARKKVIPSTAGTLETHTPLFIVLLISIILALGALSFFPTLVLGPITEYLMLK